MKWTFYLAALLCVYCANAQYDSNRLGAVCNGVRQPDGTCDTCPTDYQEYNCAVYTPGIGQGDCLTTLTCSNGGTCFDDSADGGTGSQCLCTPEYTGATCDDLIFEFSCGTGPASRSLTITPAEAGYPGFLYVKDQMNTAGCADLDETDPLELLNIDDTTCGGTVTNGSAELMTFVWRQQQNVLRSTDFIIITKCGDGDTVDKGVQITSVTANIAQDLNEEQQGDTPTEFDVYLALFDDTHAALSGPVLLGDEVIVKSDLTSLGYSNGFASIRLDACKITDGGANEVAMITDNCITIEQLFASEPVLNNTQIYWSFYAFKFLDQPGVTVDCTIKVCVNSGDCDPDPLCDGPGLGRKKRDVDQDKTETFALRQRFDVVDPLGQAVQTIQEFKESKACYQTWEMTATVVALSVALFIVVLICIILVVKMFLSRRSHTTYREEVSESASTTHFPHLPTIVSNKA